MAGAGVALLSLAATVRPNLVAGIEDRGYAVLIGHPSVRAQIGPRRDASDPATAEPDEIQGLAAVVDLCHQGHDVGARSKGHTANGATHAGLAAVHQVGYRGPAQAPGVLLQIIGFELELGPSQARRHAGKQPGPATGTHVFSLHHWSHQL